MRLIGYVRVSTQGQVDDGYGLDVQTEAITTWAKRNGHQVTTIANDQGVSGTLPAEQRPGLATALATVRNGSAEGLVVHRLDRLARSLAVQEGALALIWNHSGHVFEVVTGEVLRDDPDDPARTAMRQMMGVFSQLERSTIVARMRAGRRMKAAQGGYAGGAPRYGWRAHNRTLVADHQEAGVVARANELRDQGASLREIADTLDREGHKAKRGGSWHPETLRRLLIN